MTWCLFGPNHYLNQCRIIATWEHRQTLRIEIISSIQPLVPIDNALQQGNIRWDSHFSNNKCTGLGRCTLNRQNHNGNRMIVNEAVVNMIYFLLNCTIFYQLWYLNDFLFIDKCRVLSLLMCHGIERYALHHTSWASYQICKIAGFACAENVGSVFRASDFKGNR